MVCQGWTVWGIVVVSLLLGVPWGHTEPLALETATEGGPSGQNVPISKAVFLSLVVPGAGHHVCGARTGAKVFFVTELSIWAGYFGFHLSGNRLEDDAILYATHRADANASRSDGEYLKAIEGYEDSDDYNRHIRQEARDRYPDDLEAQRRYVDDHGITSEDRWSWSTTGSWDRFRDMRSDSRKMHRYAVYCTGAALLNRLIAAIDAARVSRHHQHIPADVVFYPQPDGLSVELTLSVPF
jgi:hypothetical protein